MAQVQKRRFEIITVNGFRLLLDRKCKEWTEWIENVQENVKNGKCKQKKRRCTTAIRCQHTPQRLTLKVVALLAIRQHLCS